MTCDYVLSHFDAMALWDAVLDVEPDPVEERIMDHVTHIMEGDAGQGITDYRATCRCGREGPGASLTRVHAQLWARSHEDHPGEWDEWLRS